VELLLQLEGLVACVGLPGPLRAGCCRHLGWGETRLEEEPRVSMSSLPVNSPCQVSLSSLHVKSPCQVSLCPAAGKSRCFRAGPANCPRREQRCVDCLV
jgi:hypothetical protein